VITPEEEFEKHALSIFQEHGLDAKIFAGSFYDCRGGWVRRSIYYTPRSMGADNNDNRLILEIKTTEDNV
jgi:hypothetical protein